jgi:hypothetical protein
MITISIFLIIVYDKVERNQKGKTGAPKLEKISRRIITNGRIKQRRPSSGGMRRHAVSCGVIRFHTAA